MLSELYFFITIFNICSLVEKFSFAFLKGNDRRFKKDYGFEAPQIQKESAQMGDVIAAGDAGLQQHAYSAHTGIYLGDDLYISQSPSPRNDVISNSKPSTIKIRDVSDLKDREKITYRSMKNAK